MTCWKLWHGRSLLKLVAEDRVITHFILFAHVFRLHMTFVEPEDTFMIHRDWDPSWWRLLDLLIPWKKKNDELAIQSFGISGCIFPCWLICSFYFYYLSPLYQLCFRYQRLHHETTRNDSTSRLQQKNDVPAVHFTYICTSGDVWDVWKNTRIRYWI